MHCFSFIVPGPSVISGEHGASRSKGDRRFEVVADTIEQRHELMRRFIGSRTENDLLTSFMGQSDDGLGSTISMLKATQRFLGSIKIVGFVTSSIKLTPDTWMFDDEWLVACEGDKERIFYSQGLENRPKSEYFTDSKYPVGWDRAQVILERF